MPIEYPELPDYLSRLGFKDITKLGMLSTTGRFMAHTGTLSAYSAFFISDTVLFILYDFLISYKVPLILN